MVDIVSPKTRSRMMSGIKGKDTKPEIIIRKELHARGYRYKLHDKKLVGRPDLVLPKYMAVIFINGCFWHGHDCHLFKWPKSRQDFWHKKISSNQKRDLETRLAFSHTDWRQLIVWECAIKGKHKIPLKILVDEIEDWLSSKSDVQEITNMTDRSN